MDARLLSFMAACAVAGCAKPLVPTFALGAHPDAVPWDQPELVTPPPSVQAEEVPPRPGVDYVWIDGQWGYTLLTKRWTWDQGAWCKPPPGARFYARAEIQRYRAPVADQPRVTRWNESQQRFEEVDSGNDQYRWRRGRFYVTAQNGSVVPWTGAVDCATAPH